MISISSTTYASPRSGVSQLFGDPPTTEFRRTRCVSPLREVWEGVSKVDSIERNIRHVHTVMNLSTFGCDDVPLDAESTTTILDGHGRYEGRIREDSKGDGQTSKIPMETVGTRPDQSPREILRVFPTVHSPRAEHEQHAPKFEPFISNAFFVESDSHHNETPLLALQPEYYTDRSMFSTRQAVESDIDPRTCSVRRIRSRAIAIKRTPREVKPHEICENSAAAEYDWATWRMYNRIIDYRQKYPVAHPNEDSSSSELSTTSVDDSLLPTQRPDEYCPGSKTDSSTANVISTYQDQNFIDHGEVFELDM